MTPTSWRALRPCRARSPSAGSASHRTSPTSSHSCAPAMPASLRARSWTQRRLSDRLRPCPRASGRPGWTRASEDARQPADRRSATAGAPRPGCARSPRPPVSRCRRSRGCSRATPTSARSCAHACSPPSRSSRYKPNLLAQSLRRQETLSVGFVVRDISNPLMAEIVKAAETRLREAGYSMLLTNSESEPELDCRAHPPVRAAAGRRAHPLADERDARPRRTTCSRSSTFRASSSIATSPTSVESAASSTTTRPAFGRRSGTSSTSGIAASTSSSAHRCDRRASAGSGSRPSSR